MDNDLIIKASRVHANDFNTPVEMLLNTDETYNDGKHVGHHIVPNFDGGGTGITEQDCINTANEFINPVTNRINVDQNRTV